MWVVESRREVLKRTRSYARSYLVGKAGPYIFLPLRSIPLLSYMNISAYFSYTSTTRRAQFGRKEYVQLTFLNRKPPLQVHPSISYSQAAYRVYFLSTASMAALLYPSIQLAVYVILLLYRPISAGGVFATDWTFNHLRWALHQWE